MTQLPPSPKRLLSLDFMRGFIMALLCLSSTGIYDSLEELYRGTAFHYFIRQFVHHPWNGLRFWDLIQPGFMFIAGTAMAFSLSKQEQMAMSWNDSFQKMLKRCGWLFFWGVLDYAVRPNGLSFELWDVLTQLSFTMLLAFLIFRWSTVAQIGVCAALLLLTEILYRFTNIPGFDQPFTDQHNFGNYMDLVLMNKINGDGWVAINCLPTAVHTIAGALAGKLLLSDNKKLQVMIVWAVVCLFVGYAMDWSGITPIIKRIATSSFTIASLGWCLLALSFCYWWIDVKDHKKYLKFFLIFGMNSIFIYVFFEIVGGRWFNGYIGAITTGLLGFINTTRVLGMVITAFTIFILEWLLCYFLYKRKIFFKV
jgi:predicted acyltransferase